GPAPRGRGRPGGGAAGLRARQGHLRGPLRAGPPARLGRHPRLGGAAHRGGHLVMATASRDPAVAAALDALAAGTCRDPHEGLGVHRDGEAVVVRSWRPEASAATLGGRPMRRIHDAGVFEVLLDAEPRPGYEVTFRWDGGG